MKRTIFLVFYCDDRAVIAVTLNECAEDSQVARVQVAQDTNIVEAASGQENIAPVTSQEREAPASSQDDVRGDLSEEDKDESLEDSNDDDWSPNEILMTKKSSLEKALECVTDLITGDECEKGCWKGKSRELEWLTCSLGQMTKAEKTTCILTLVGVLMQTDTATRRRGKSEREKFHYYLPFVGQVCRSAFAHCLGVKPLTIQRYKRRVREGNIAAKEHGNKRNKNASTIDAV
ncbi:hypothetical protein F442_08821 [Phytophthora nicotianae P10297]|uniref:Uncharacterized protein n=2 Tax=Phytophthora nicotianae TaxID=4792 RepID=W2ZC38_PHYNI|nr:hypothetical protein F444_08948 [Phytophthora nicotianae P1976]ETP44640.1 hypothetical protein F442_08821 [Phytophthora nicotianae P10297]